MRLWHMLHYRLRALFFGRRMDRELDEELRDHLAREAEAGAQSGMPEAEARRTAAVKLGGVTRFAEEARDARGWRWLRDAATDLRHAFRLLHRYPGYALGTIAIAALGIAVTTVVFSAVNGVLLRPLPFRAPQQLALAQLTSTGDGFQFAGSGLEWYHQLAQQQSIIAAVGGYGLGSAVLMQSGEPEHVDLEYLTPSAVRLLGVQPTLGRLFTDDDTRNDQQVALLSHAFWMTRLGGDSSVVGRPISLDGRQWVVVGVMPADFGGPLLRHPALWLPARVAGGFLVSAGEQKRGAQVLLRLQPGVTADRAAAWLAPRMSMRTVSVVSGDSITARWRVVDLRDVVLLDSGKPLLVLFGAVGFVMLLVAVNIATLGLARATSRSREMAVRRAMGASRSRHIRQVLTEILLLMALGGTLGVLLARAGVAWFVHAGVEVLPRLSDIRLDWQVLAFAAGLTLVAALFAGAAPALLSTENDLEDTLRGGHRAGDSAQRNRLRAVLVLVEVALSVLLLAGAGTLIKAFVDVVPTHPGFAVNNRIVVEVRLHELARAAASSSDDSRRFVDEAARRMRGVPGVRDVAAAAFLPFIGMTAMYPITLEGGVSSPGAAHERPVSSNYFDVMQIPVVAGRGFTPADDRAGPPVAIINQTAAKRWWPNASPIGRHLTWGRRGDTRTTAEVVGVVRDVRSFGLNPAPVAKFYLPYDQAPSDFVDFVVATTGDPRGPINALKRQIWDIKPDLPIDQVATFSDLIGDSVKEAHLYVVLMSVFALAALVLAAAGIFSVLAYAVSQRTREIGIRLALGAPPWNVSRLVLRQGTIIVGGGVMAGLGAAALLTRVLQHVLEQVKPFDPMVFAGTAVALLAVALLACVVPVRRALSVDPLTTMRSE
jgi:putative ABC transport system permease protein